MPNVRHGDGTTKYGPGVLVELSGSELARAVDVYLLSQGVVVRGPRTIRYDGELLEDYCQVYVDPSGFVIHQGKKFSGRGEGEE
jgi:hypothetical protein